MLNANRLHRINIKRLLLSFSLVVASLSATGCGNSAAQSEANTFVGKRNPVNETIPQASAPICSVDRFQQPKDPISKKVDVLFVMDNSNSMNRHWQLMAKGIGKLIHAFPPGQDIRFSVVLGTITKFPGVLFSDPSVPKVLDGKKMSEQQIINALTKTFSYAMRYENIDWKGAGEALFYSLYYATTANALAIQKQGFFRQIGRAHV